MFELRCTVRHCGRRLSPKERGLFCDANHHFDRAREGYWSLIQPQDRKSANPGDCDEAVLARHRWLSLPHMDGLIETLRNDISLRNCPEIVSRFREGEAPAEPECAAPQERRPPSGVGPPRCAEPISGQSLRADSRTLDLGCGEGSFGRALFENEPNGYCGIDLSRRALRLAARSWPDATWVLGNADRILPVMDHSVDRVITLFGRRPVSEIARALKPGGTCVVAVPGEEDLIELREQTQATGNRRSRWEAIAEEFSGAGLHLQSHTPWTHQAELSREAIHDAMRMTYRAVRRSQQARIEQIDAMKVTLAADLMHFTSSS